MQPLFVTEVHDRVRIDSCEANPSLAHRVIILNEPLDRLPNACARGSNRPNEEPRQGRSAFDGLTVLHGREFEARVQRAQLLIARRLFELAVRGRGVVLWAKFRKKRQVSSKQSRLVPNKVGMAPECGLWGSPWPQRCGPQWSKWGPRPFLLAQMQEGQRSAVLNWATAKQARARTVDRENDGLGRVVISQHPAVCGHPPNQNKPVSMRENRRQSRQEKLRGNSHKEARKVVRVDELTQRLARAHDHHRLVVACAITSCRRESASERPEPIRMAVTLRVVELVNERGDDVGILRASRRMKSR